MIIRPILNRTARASTSALLISFLLTSASAAQSIALEGVLNKAITLSCGASPPASTNAFQSVEALSRQMDCTVGVIAYLRSEADKSCGIASERDTATRAKRRARCAKRSMVRAAGKPIPPQAIAAARQARTDEALRLLLKHDALPADVTVSVSGRQYEWGFRQAIGSKHCRYDTTLVLPDGKRARLHVTSEDIIHTFSVPELGIKIDAVPGRLSVADIQGAALGRYSGTSTVGSGSGWRDMTFAIEVKSIEAYAAWEREMLMNSSCKDSP